jgi:hypothetical protein
MPYTGTGRRVTFIPDGDMYLAPYFFLIYS